jgi:hypothetical protein
MVADVTHQSELLGRTCCASVLGPLRGCERYCVAMASGPRRQG